MRVDPAHARAHVGVRELARRQPRRRDARCRKKPLPLFNAARLPFQNREDGLSGFHADDLDNASRDCYHRLLVGGRWSGYRHQSLPDRVTDSSGRMHLDLVGHDRALRIPAFRRSGRTHSLRNRARPGKLRLQHHKWRGIELGLAGRGRIRTERGTRATLRLGGIG